MGKKPAAQIEQSWPASSVELWPLERIAVYDKNPRTHPDSQIDLIAASMKSEGVTAPIMVDESGVIIYGHGRRLAALKNGFKNYPVVIARGWSEEKKKAARIKDNQYANLSGWDMPLMQAELGALQLVGYDMQLLGFEDHQLAEFMSPGNAGEVDPDETPEPPKKPVVRKGDLWVLGSHRLLCGDSTKAEDVAKVMGGGLADLVFTDPPYNVAYSGLGQNRLGTIENDDQTDAAFEKFLSATFEQIADAMKPLASIYVCHPDAASAPKLAYEHTFAACFQKSATIIWVKNAAGMGWQDYRSRHEPMLYGWKAGRGKHHFYGDRTKTTVWDISRDAQASYEHPTQKPVALAMEAIVNSSRKGQIVFDPFVGAGGVLIACEMTGRKAAAIELDPRYVEVCILRLEKFTGKKATLDGKTLDQVAKARRKGNPKGKSEDERDIKIARKRLAEIKHHPESLVSGKDLELASAPAPQSTRKAVLARSEGEVATH